MVMSWSVDESKVAYSDVMFVPSFIKMNRLVQRLLWERDMDSVDTTSLSSLIKL